MSSVSQGKLVGSKGAIFRKISTSKAKKEQDIINRTKAAA